MTMAEVMVNPETGAPGSIFRMGSEVPFEDDIISAEWYGPIEPPRETV